MISVIFYLDPQLFPRACGLLDWWRGGAIGLWMEIENHRYHLHDRRWARAWARLGALQRSTCSVTIIIVAHCFRSGYVATERVERAGRPIATPKQPTPCRNAFGAMAGFLASLRVIGRRGRRDVPTAARWWSAVKWVPQAATMPTAETLAGNVTPRGAASSPSEKPVQPIDLMGPSWGMAERVIPDLDLALVTEVIAG